MNNFVRVVLPKTYDLVVGDTFQLFYRGVVEAADPSCYDILAVCKQGKNYPRYFECTPQEEGCFRLTLTVFDNEKNVLASGETMLCIHAPKRAPEKNIHILCIGDSLTAPGIWVEEANRRVSEHGGEPEGLGFAGFQFIGTCRKGRVGYEGYGGWTWSNYLQVDKNRLSAVWISCKHKLDYSDQHSFWKDEAGELWQLETIETERLKFNRVADHKGENPKEDTTLVHYGNAQHTDDILVCNSYSEIPNPFCDPETESVDFRKYCARNAFEGIDAVFFFLSWNGLFGLKCSIEEFCRSAVEEAKQLVDILHSQYPAVRIKIMGLQVPSVSGGMGANYGAELPYCDDYGMTRYVMELNRVYEAWTMEEEYAAFMEFINISGQFDSDYNMPAAEKRVNTRNARKEWIGTNGVHPLPEGYLQIADAVYRNLVKNYCSQNQR